MDLMDDEDDDMGEPAETRPERAFLQLWKALSQWVTPEAVAFVKSQRQNGQQHPLQPPSTEMVATKGSRSFSLLHSSPPVIVVSSTGSHHGSLGTVNAVDFGDDDEDHPDGDPTSLQEQARDEL